MTMPRDANPVTLWLVHRDGAGTARERDAFRAEVGTGGVVLETCLRRLAFGVGSAPPLTGQWLTGGDAYRQLLEVIAGLRSAVVGETNVAGQFRRAWAEASLGADLRSALAPVVETLLADAATVRRTHLQGLGGSSWGTLVRRLLAPRAGQRVLVIGAGDLAASVAPYLRHVDLGLWNRRPVPAGRRAGFATVGTWFDHGQANAAARWAEIAIVTSPADVDHDAAWLARFAARPEPLAAGVHLGQREPTAFRWPAGTRGYLLDDVLELARTQQSRRSEALHRARQHCASLAAARQPSAQTRPGLRALA
jgi:mono/diheme cytochrome c family protein